MAVVGRVVRRRPILHTFIHPKNHGKDVKQEKWGAE
jgi:hypothetical protein